jgi:hypothetical protein
MEMSREPRHPRIYSQWSYDQDAKNTRWKEKHWGMEEEPQTMYTHVSKCKNNTC